MILTSTVNRPWTPDGFRASWRKACAKAGIVGVTFNDLRGTAVTRLALCGCTEAEIATITSHNLRDVRRDDVIIAFRQHDAGERAPSIGCWPAPRLASRSRV